MNIKIDEDTKDYFMNNHPLTHKNFSSEKVSISMQDKIISLKPNEKAQPTRSASRCDKYGNTISKKGMKHKVTFVDQIEKSPLSETKRVESYKEFNKLEESKKGKDFYKKILI